MSKSEAIHQSGVEAFMAGTTLPFSLKAVEQTFSNQLLVALRFKTASTWQAQNTILREVSDIARGSDATLFLAGRDFPFHCTAKVAVYSGSLEGKDEIFGRYGREDRVHNACKGMRGSKLMFPNLVLDPSGNGLLTNDEADPDLVQFRSILDQLLRDRYPSLDPRPIDWAHCTLFRTISAPASERVYFVRQFDREKEHLLAEPLQLEVADVFVGNCWEFLT